MPDRTGEIRERSDRVRPVGNAAAGGELGSDRGEVQKGLDEGCAAQRLHSGPPSPPRAKLAIMYAGGVGS